MRVRVRMSMLRDAFNFTGALVVANDELIACDRDEIVLRNGTDLFAADDANPFHADRGIDRSFRIALNLTTASGCDGQSKKDSWREIRSSQAIR